MYRWYNKHVAAGAYYSSKTQVFGLSPVSPGITAVRAALRKHLPGATVASYCQEIQFLKIRLVFCYRLCEALTNSGATAWRLIQVVSNSRKFP